jgi:hypothetical protein
MATQVLVNSGESLHVSWYIDGVLTDPDGTATTVTITKDSDGSAIVTGGVASQAGQGVYLYSLQPQARLDRLTVVWSATFNGLAQSVTTYVDIVGGYYVSLNELANMKNLSDSSKFTPAKLIDARLWFEAKFERYTGRAFVPRYKKLVMWGTGSSAMQLPDENIRTLRGVQFGTVNLSDAALANIALEASGRIQHFWPLGVNGPDDSFGIYGSSFPINARITIAYEYGTDFCPDDVRDVAKTAIYDHLLNDQSGRREYSAITDLGIIRYSKPGPDRPFGIESVDEVANDRRRPGWRADRLTAGSVPIR